MQFLVVVIDVKNMFAILHVMCFFLRVALSSALIVVVSKYLMRCWLTSLHLCCNKNHHHGSSMKTQQSGLDLANKNNHDLALVSDSLRSAEKSPADTRATNDVERYWNKRHRRTSLLASRRVRLLPLLLLLRGSRVWRHRSRCHASLLQPSESKADDDG